MFGSQVLETVIGLSLMFFVLALGASAGVEAISRLLSKRSKNLEAAIGAMLTGTTAAPADVERALTLFKGTSVYDSALAAAGRSTFRREWKRPSYLSATTFADAIHEISLLDDEVAKLPPLISTRVAAIKDEVGDDVLKVKAELEAWYDRNMERLSGAYKRWSTAYLFGFGLLFAISANASTFHVADELWTDPVVREAVVESATGVAAGGADAVQIESVADATAELESLQLPIGWRADSEKVWDNDPWVPLLWSGQQWGYVAGWLMTALLVMFGAPFWFDVLTKAVSLRSSGAKPPVAHKDETSATAAVAARTTANVAVDVNDD